MHVPGAIGVVVAAQYSIEALKVRGFCVVKLVWVSREDIITSDKRVHTSILVSRGSAKYVFMDSKVSAMVSSEIPWFLTASACQ